MEKIIRACGLLLAMAVVLVLNSCFDSSVECIGCNGRGVFTFGDVSVQCKYCHGTGTITKELANSLMPEQEDYEDEEPINDGYYCNICMGTGKFRTNSFPFEGIGLIAINRFIDASIAMVLVRILLVADNVHFAEVTASLL